MYEQQTAIIGTTGYGKSFFAKKTLLKDNRGVLFYNTICDPDDFRGWTETDGNIDIKSLVAALDKGKKINFQAVKDMKRRECELEYIVNYFIYRVNKPFILAVDEVHMIESKETKNALKNCAQMGRHQFILPVWISQRPQQLDRSLITMSPHKYIFYTEMETSYWKTYGIDPVYMEQQIAGRPYYYIEKIAGKPISAAKKI